MQFVVLPAEELGKAGAMHIVSNTPAILWMAPLGEQGSLRCIGYYLFREETERVSRLKRIYISPENKAFFPRMLDIRNPGDTTTRTSAVNADWFLRNWNAKAFNEEDIENDSVIVSTVADNVIGLWIQCIDMLGNPIPWLSNAPNHPKSELIYNSAATFKWRQRHHSTAVDRRCFEPNKADDESEPRSGSHRHHCRNDRQ